MAGVIADMAANLYGTTEHGGDSYREGIVFKLAPPAHGIGEYTESITHLFNARTYDGALLAKVSECAIANEGSEKRRSFH